MAVLYFQSIPRKNRARGLVPTIRRCSKKFRVALTEGDEQKQRTASQEAWDAMTKLFEILRGEQDCGRLSSALMDADTGFVMPRISSETMQEMLSQKKIDRTRAVTLNLREALNKIAHYEHVAYRVDRRDAHYLLLGGVYRNSSWVAEILISKLCKNAAAAIQGIAG